MNLKHVTKKIKNVAHKGFTLPELLVSISIMIIITSVVVINYRNFDNTIVLTSLSYDIGLSIRKAQTYGLSVKGFENTFDYAYGIHFDTTNTNSYILFADINDNKVYDQSSTGGVDEKIERYRIQNGFSIDALCLIDQSGSNSDCTGNDNIDITFKRPNPDALVYVNNSITSQAAEIQIASPQGSIKSIIIRNTGQISIQ